MLGGVDDENDGKGEPNRGIWEEAAIGIKTASTTEKSISGSSRWRLHLKK